VTSIAGALLAAGRGSRYGASPKLTAGLGGRAVVAWAFDAVSDAGLDPVVLVLGREADAVRAAVGEPPAVRELVVVRNDRWESGIASSLGAAIGAVQARPDVEALVVGLGDQPGVGPEAYRRLARAYDAGARLAVATYAGVRANPVLVARDHWDEALGLEGDEGARVLMQHHPVVEVPCDGTGEPTDVDTPHDLAALEARWRSPTGSE
jgi:molybdenum cofactor cytidylyltransferase/nicotine blue oxidoreductase